MNFLYVFLGALFFLFFNSCDPDICIFCNKPENNYRQFRNADNYSLSNEDSSIIHVINLIDSTVGKSGEQCHINSARCDFYNVYNYESVSLNTNFEYIIHYLNRQPGNDSFAILSLELSIQESPYEWYKYKFYINNLKYSYKKRTDYLDSITLNGYKFYDVLELDTSSIIKKSNSNIDVKFSKIYYSVHQGIIGLIDQKDNLLTLK